MHLRCLRPVAIVSEVPRVQALTVTIRECRSVLRVQKRVTVLRELMHRVRERSREAMDKNALTVS